jgi:putative DNA primase/helicase
LWLPVETTTPRRARAFTPMTQQNHLPTNPIRFAVNTSGKDKDFNYELLARDFKDTSGTIEDIANHVKAGHAICAGLLGNRRRCKANVIGSNLVLIDIDNSDVERDAEGKPIKDSEGKIKKIFKHQLAIAEALEDDFVKNYCAIIYTTASHTPEWEKFRLIFVLPEYTEGSDTVEASINLLLEGFPHDPACKDASRVFFGSTKAEFPLINSSATLPEDWTVRAIEAAEAKKQETEQRLREWEENKARYREYSAQQGWDTDKLIEEALSFIPPRCPGSGNYKECTDVLMALTSHYGAVDAEALAEKWSPSKGKWDIGKKIRSYQSNGIGIGTLFHIAKQYGFRFPARTTPELPRPSVIKIQPPTDAPTPKPLTSKPPKGIPGDAVEIIYTYSDNQWVVGYQYGEPGLEEIEFRQYHRLPDHTIEMRKGVKPWNAYKLSEVLATAAAKHEKTLPILVLAQNERQVEVARENGVSAFTFAGKVWSRDEVRAELLKAKKQLGEFVISWISSIEEDTIQDGKKLVLVGSICQELGIKIVVSEADADYELTAVEEVLETNPANIEEKVIAELEKPAPQKKPIALSENNQNFIDHSNPDSNIYSIIKALSLDPKNCATFITFESWMYTQKFASGEDWITIDSAYYRWIEAEQIWRHQPDNVVLKLIAEAGAQAYAIKNTKDFSWVATKPYESNAHKEAAFKYNRNRLELPQEYLTKNIHLLAFNNCVVDLRTGENFPHIKDYYLTNKIPHDYEANKTCPEVFLNFVVDSFGEEFIEVIRAFTSMFLDPTAPYGRFPYLVGQSGGGKGTLLRFWARLFGKEGSGSASNFADISTPEGRHQYLTGKRIFMFPDMGGYTAGLRAFYEIVDNGEMTGRALYNSATYSKTWNVRFGVGSVDYLQIENSGDGFGRRAYVIPVRNRTVTPDQYLAQKLEAVKADVISWALAMDKEERDRILLSPPESERAKIATLNAALHADSTRSFVDLCLRPTSETTIVSNALLHELYKAYCKIHGYSPLGMSKFISHLKTILPYNFSERSWNPMVDGVRERTQAHWEYIRIPVEIFRTIGLNTESEQQQYNPEWVCVKSQCQEGGLTEFEQFWNQPRVQGGFNSQQTPETTTNKDVEDSEEPNNTQTPPTENEQSATDEVPSPEDVTYNLSTLQDGIASMSWDMILELTVCWTQAMKQAVWSALSKEDKKAVKLLNPNSPKEAHNAHNNDATPPTFPCSYIGRECIVKSGDHTGQGVVIRDYIAEDDEFWAFYKSGDNEYYFGVKYCDLTFDIHPNGDTAVNAPAPIVETIQLQSEVEIVAYGKHKGKSGSVVEVPSSTRAFNPKQYRVSFFDGSERISVWFYEWELKIVEVLEEIPGF